MTSATSRYLPAGRSIVWTSGDGRCQLFCLACRPSIPWAMDLLATSQKPAKAPFYHCCVSCVRVLDEHVPATWRQSQQNFKRYEYKFISNKTKRLMQLISPLNKRFLPDEARFYRCQFVTCSSGLFSALHSVWR